MNLKKYCLLILFLGAGTFSLLTFGNDKINHPVLKNNSVQQVNDFPQITLGQKIDEQSSVTVIVTPIDILSQSKEWKFDVGMNTHAVELDQDMTKIAVLVDDQGKEYKPIAWEGPIGGHHREGVLIFKQINPASKSVELKIKDIGGVAERLFKWDLE